jgi:hypothetical protein
MVTWIHSQSKDFSVEEIVKAIRDIGTGEKNCCVSGIWSRKLSDPNYFEKNNQND